MLLQTDRQTGYPSIDKPWLKYYTSEDLEINIPACTVYQNIYDRNKDYPDDVAIQYFGNRIPYKTLFLSIDQCAKALKYIGIQPGDCVTLCTAGVPEAIYLVLACSRIGAVANFLNPLFTKEQLIERINETEARWIFVLDAMYSYVEAALPETCIQNIVIIPVTNSFRPILSKLLYLKMPARKLVKHGIETKHYYLWKEFCKYSSKYTGDATVPYVRDTPTVMVYSSGSTGASKGIQLTNDGINATISNYQTHSYTHSRGDTFLQMIPVWFSTGIVLSVLMPLTLGMTVIPEPKFSTTSFVKDLIKYKPTLTLAATSLWMYAIDAEEMKNADFSDMKYPITGGEKILARDEARMNDFLKEHHCKTRMYKGYGMCELGGTVSTSTNATGYVDKPLGAGIPILHATVSAFDIDTNQELSYGQHEEIRVLTPAHMKGYYKNPEATAEFFKTDEHGNVWGCTGDIGYVDKDGEVFILGRAKDHYHRENGELVYLFDIEEEIWKDRDINRCKVVYFKTENEIVTDAHVVLQKEVTEEIEVLKRIHRRLTNSLPDYMIPQYYKARTSMPVHNNGKLDVYALRDDRDNLISREQLL